VLDSTPHIKGDSVQAMKNLRFAPVCLLVLAAPALAASPAPAENCQLKRYGSVEMYISPAGFVTIPVTINGVPTRMALQTGSSLSIIGSAFVRKHEITTIPVPSALRFGGARVTDYVRLDRLQIGPLALGRVQLLVDPDPVYSGTIAQVDSIMGAVGIGLFSNVDIELDFQQRLLTLWSPEHCKGKVVYWSTRYDSVPMKQDPIGGMSFRMELEGRTLDTVLATGDSLSVLRTDVSKKLYGFDETSPGVEPEPGTNGGRAYYRAMELTTDGLSVMNARVRLNPEESKCRLVTSKNRSTPTRYEGCLNVYPLRLGMNVLSRLRLYIASREKMLYYTVADASLDVPPPAPPPASTETTLAP
jgi:predicted aspartyl protease